MLDTQTPIKMPESIKEQHERIKQVNYQQLLDVLCTYGIDAIKIPRIGLDKLLRIQNDLRKHENAIKLLFSEFLKITNPYKAEPHTDTCAPGVPAVMEQPNNSVIYLERENEL